MLPCPLGETWARLFLFLWQESDLGFDSRVTVPTGPKGTLRCELEKGDSQRTGENNYKPNVSYASSV